LKLIISSGQFLCEDLFFKIQCDVNNLTIQEIIKILIMVIIIEYNFIYRVLE
jgi:hypothetical protein